MYRVRSWQVALLSGTIVFFSLLGVANAASISVSDSVPETFLPLDDTVTFPQFDPDIGILTDVRVRVTSDISGSFGYENPLQIAQMLQGQVEGSATITIPGGSSVVADESLALINETLPPQGGGSTLFRQTISATATFSSPTVLDAFVGTGTVELPIAAGAQWNAGGNIANVAITLISRGDARGEIEYIFQVPEVSLQKLTNGADADDANGPDVPEITPGEPITWSYLVENTGVISIPLASIVVTDSHPAVTPQFDPLSDDGDELLAPGETWSYIATGMAADLLDPVATEEATIVNGCDNQGSSQFGTRATYENSGYVRIPGNQAQDDSHYCNPAAPGIDIEKSTNGAQADLPDDPDVPRLSPGEVVRWEYVVTNSGNVTFTLAQVEVTDSTPGVTPQFDPAGDNGDDLLTPDEQWRFFAEGTALALSDLPAGSAVTTVEGCPADASPTNPTPRAYQNTGIVTVPGAGDQDDSHYCNLPLPTVVNLLGFWAVVANDGVVLHWEVATSWSGAGFHIQRSANGEIDQAVTLTSSPISEPNAEPTGEGYGYLFIDDEAPFDSLYGYWLIEVGGTGKKTAYGPIWVQMQRDAEQHLLFLPQILNR